MKSRRQSIKVAAMYVIMLSSTPTSLFGSSRFSHASSASLGSGLPRATTTNIASVTSWFEETKGSISNVFSKKEVSISTYDTAWVAMAPSPSSLGKPCFPEALFWLLENQCHDGSWARPHHHSTSLLKKDVLSSTLACILALKKWGLGDQHIDKGLQFLEMNFDSATDPTQITPIGFEIVFPTMLDHARGLSLNPNVDQTMLNDLMNMRDLELKRCSSSPNMEAYLAYIGEGMGKLQDWESEIMKYQRKNGSLFNSPSTTAAAFTALGNSECLNYLNLVVNKFEGAVPAVYPLDIYSQLCTVDNLEKLGISRYFVTEIQSVLDQVYRCWVEGDEDIFMDASTCALAFRLLRMNGYNVASDSITSCVGGHMKDINAALQLYKASEVALYPHELTQMEKLNSSLRALLQEELSSASIQSTQLHAEVKQALDYPFYAILQRMANRKAIEHYNFDHTRILKTSYCMPGNKDFLHLSVEDFNRCQAIHQEEYKEFQRWFAENRLDELELARQKLEYCYFTAAATMFAPELSEARMSWAKNALMVSVMDDFFDVRGSVEEKEKIVELVELWDVDISREGCSNDVSIIFSALKRTVVEVGEKGSQLQGRSITTHIIALWLDLLYSYMKEVEWSGSSGPYPCSFGEYMSNGAVSVGLGPILLTTLYVVGPHLSQHMLNHPEYHNLFTLTSTCSRLLNEIRCDERELQEGKLNALPLYIAENGGENEMSKEAAIAEMISMINTQRKEILRIVLDDNSVLPKPCKQIFWIMIVANQLIYSKDDGFWSQELLQLVPQIIHQPILLPTTMHAHFTQLSG